MHLIFKLATAATVTATDLALDEETGLSLLQLRAHKVGDALGEEKGRDLIKRPIVGDIGTLQFIDIGVGPFEEAGKLASVKFYAGRSGNRGLRFRIFRPRPGLPRTNGGQIQAFDYIGQTEVIEVPTTGLNEHEFSVQVPFLKGDYIGWVHPAHGNINYGDVAGSPRNEWATNQVWYSGHGATGNEANCQQTEKWSSAHRWYSYKITTVPSTAADYSGAAGDVLCGADMPDSMVDESAAVGDPHLSYGGHSRDLEPSDIRH